MSEDRLIDADAMYKKLIEVGSQWADCKAAYHELDEASSAVLADLTQAYRTEDLSRAEAETLAKRSSQYRDHLASVAIAHKAFLRAQVKYDSLKTLVELRRSEESSRRAEMRL